ncbi:hypothetical protein BGZ83_003239 [Gryganskiella cystojenkinii]|nr:hypothetical protein BGZ83_003239 [Gryganskiella cystojenkinii]
MSFTANDPAAHCVGLIQPASLPFEYGQNSKVLSNNHDNNGNNELLNNNGSSAIMMTSGPPGQSLDYTGALQYLFSQAKESVISKALCEEIELSMAPPIEIGVVSYLYRLQAVGRLQDWPLLFGEGNSFILYLLNKMEKDEFPPGSLNERTIWNDRRRETVQWVQERTKKHAGGSSLTIDLHH